METATVTGASRGVGKGIAGALAQNGYRVLATGRNITSTDLPSSVVPIACDHRDDRQTAAIFEQVGSESKRLGVLVNSAWSPEFIGRVVAALAREAGIMERSGKVLVAAEIAREFDIKDVDGRQPTPLTIETA